MEKRKVTSEGYFRMLLILFGAMLMSQFTLAGVFVYVVMMGEATPEPEAASIMAYVVPAVVSLAFGASILLPKSLISKAADKPTLSEKLSGYQTAFIIRCALIELGSVCGGVAYFLTLEYYWLAINAVAIAFFALGFPSRMRAIEALRLSGPEVALVNDPKAVIMEQEITSD